jgi:DMSO/TMAO reductase YedYZ molybdopterin-dependent catalytic subunit
MNKKILVLTLTFVLLCSVAPLAIIPVNAADITTSVTVTKMANDGTTVLDQVTVTVEEMMAGSPELPIYGDGVTHYYFQGPTFDLDNMWDSGIAPEPAPGETVNVDSRDYGAAMGTDVKDLCEMLPNGGASPGDEIEIKASDGFSKMFDYDDAYNPEPEQGKMIITWYTDGTADGMSGSVTDGSYSTGMRLLFFAETLNPDGKHVFGNWDMHETLAESRWHYYYDGTLWPSSSGLSVKWVSDIIIYSSEEPPVPETWTLTLTGADTYVMNQTEFEDGADPSCHGVTWVDGTDTWSGIPLWRLVGWVDDDVQHGEGAFNDGLASAGYDVTIIASDGYSKTFASADVARNDNMIIANKLNGEELPENRYPLRLVGPDLSGGQKVGMITEIQLLNLPKGDASASLNATANVVIEMVGIDLDRDSIDYGDVVPGDSSAVEAVGIDNIGTLNCDVTLEINGANIVAQSFYEQSLYIDGGLYNADAVIASIPVAGSESVDTQVQVPLSWAEGTGAQDATFIFWATASD